MSRADSPEAQPASAAFAPPAFLFGGDWSPEQWDRGTWREDMLLRS